MAQVLIQRLKMQPVGNSTPAREAPAGVRRPFADEPQAKEVPVKRAAPVSAQSVQRAQKTTGDGGKLSVTDLSTSPQPGWGHDAFSTKLHLELQRLFAKSEPGSGHAASRMYERVGKA